MKDYKIKMETGVLQRYAELSYDEWYALAEFVDNSLHSFMLNKKDLKQKGVDKCLVNIDVIKGGSTINIVDFSGGIHEDDFEQLLTLGRPKEKAENQLSEFGMGMKTAGIWLGNKIEIETKSYLDKRAFKILIDVNKAGTEDLVKVNEVLHSSNEISYTKITITDLNRKLKRKIGTIKEALASIYRKYIESGELELKFDGVPLKPITTPIMTDPSGAEAKKNFVIELKNGKKCRGWIAVMESSSLMSRYSGFSIYRHKRLIRGYPENLWKPRTIFGVKEGGSNLRRTQRLFGELDMTEFRATHTKNRIRYVGEEEDEFIDKLIEQSREMMKIADLKKNVVTSTPKEIEGDIDLNIIKDDIEEFINNPDNTDIVDEMKIISPDVINSSPKLCKEALENGSPFMTFNEARQIPGFKKDIKVFHIKNKKAMYMIMDIIDDTLVICINMFHDYWRFLYNNKSNKKAIDEFYLNCVFDAIAELDTLENNYGKFTPDQIRIAKDVFLQNYQQSHE